MGLIFFPLIGLGPFATYVGLGIAPAVMSLAVVPGGGKSVARPVVG